MPRRRSFKERRRRVFVACEGASEAGYSAFLGRLFEDERLSLHLDIRVYPAGDPLAIVEDALDDMRRRVNLRGAYALKGIFLDGDRRNVAPQRTQRADQLILRNDLFPIWSMPTFEALLLRHLPNCESLRPPTAELAHQELRRRWPEYTKGMSAAELQRRLDLAAVVRVAGVDAQLRSFLIAAGLLR